MSLALVTGPASEPVTLVELRSHCRIDDNTSDGDLAGYLLAARQWAEGLIGRKLVTQTWDYGLTCLPRIIALPIGPVQSVTSITYVDTAGITQALPDTDFQVDTRAHVARIAPAYGKVFPPVRTQFDAVTIRVVVGYSATNPMPEEIRQAILMMVGHFDKNREAVNIGNIVNEVPFSVRALLDPLRVYY